MGGLLRKHATTMIVAMVTAAVTAGGPALAHGVQHALFAHNADKVDGKHAVGAGAKPAARAGKLVATTKAGRLPNNIIAKAPNANLLDGIDSSGFLRKAAKAADSDKLDGLDSTAFLAQDAKAADSDKLDGLDSTALWTKDETDSLRAKHFVASIAYGSTYLTSSCTNRANLALTVTAPGRGYVEVSGTAWLYANHTTGTATFAYAKVGSTPTDCGDWAGAGALWIPSGMPTGAGYHTVPVTRTFYIPSAGTHTYYLTGTGSTNVAFNYARLNGTFFPN